MKVLLSIKPEFAEKIFDGKKKYEFRKAVFKDPSVKTVVVYATKPVGKVVGEFDIEQVLQDRPSSIWEETKEFSGITKRFFTDYFRGREKAFAIKVKNPLKYLEPLDLTSVVTHGVPPQSFCYLR